jgi:hypothetical protein
LWLYQLQNLLPRMIRTGLINLKLFNLKKQLAILHGRPLSLHQEARADKVAIISIILDLCLDVHLSGGNQRMFAEFLYIFTIF